MVYDPRPLHLRQPDPQAIETLQCDLLAIYEYNRSISGEDKA